MENPVCLVSVCPALTPRTLYPLPTPQNRGTCSTGLETGYKPVLFNHNFDFLRNGVPRKLAMWTSTVTSTTLTSLIRTSPSLASVTTQSSTSTQSIAPPTLCQSWTRSAVASGGLIKDAPGRLSQGSHLATVKPVTTNANKILITEYTIKHFWGIFASNVNE